jgi:hypothetical protein
MALLAFPPGEASPQEDPAQVLQPVVELEQEYQAAIEQHEAALSLWGVREREFNTALEELNDATEAGDEARADAAFTEIQRLGPILTELRNRVENLTQGVRDARDALISARVLELEGLVARIDSITTPQDSLDLAIEMEDTRLRIEALRSAEDPPEALEPEPDITASRTDTPAQLRGKANVLDRRADQREAQLVAYGRRLEELRNQQSLERRSRDFLAGVTRYDAATLPVAGREVRNRQAGDPGQALVVDTLGGGVVPLTLEERIETLLLVQAQLEEQIQQIRGRAQNLRRLAGGVWAE